MKLDTWIIDGNYLRTLDMRLSTCNTVFLMDYPLKTCLLGAQEQIGLQREDMPWLETSFDPAFKQWIIDFPKDQLPFIYERLQPYRDQLNMIIFKSRVEADAFLKNMETQENL